MFPMMGWGWNWDWGWGWAAFIGSLVLLVILIVPWFFFLWNLQTLLQRVDPRNRAMAPAHVWLNFIPVFNLGWFIYTVIKVKESLLAEYGSRGWAVEGDQGYNVGIATGVLAIASFFLGWVPVIGWGVGIAQLICWVLYWLKTNELKNLLGGAAPWPYTASGGYPGGRPDPYAPAGPPTYDHRPAAAAPGAWAASQPQPPQPPQPPPYPWSEPQSPMYGTEPPAAPSAWTAAAAAEAEESGMAAAAAAAAATGAAAAAPAPEASEEQPARTWSAPPVWPTSAAEEPAVPVEESAAEPARQCAACGSEYDPADKFCRSCGLRLP